MTTSHLKTVLPGPVQTVWAIVRDVQRYPNWRSDVERVETPDARTFREYTKGGYVTNFTIIGEEPCRRWEFTMDNDNMTGRWVGAFRHRGGFYRVRHRKEVLDAAFRQMVSETPAGTVCGGFMGSAASTKAPIS